MGDVGPVRRLDEVDQRLAENDDCHRSSTHTACRTEAAATVAAAEYGPAGEGGAPAGQPPPWALRVFIWSKPTATRIRTPMAICR